MMVTLGNCIENTVGFRQLFSVYFPFHLQNYAIFIWMNVVSMWLEMFPTFTAEVDSECVQWLQGTLVKWNYLFFKQMSFRFPKH